MKWKTSTTATTCYASAISMLFSIKIRTSLSIYLHYYKNQFNDIFRANIDPKRTKVHLTRKTVWFLWYFILSVILCISLVAFNPTKIRNDFVEIGNLSDRFFCLYCCFDLIWIYNDEGRTKSIEPNHIGTLWMNQQNSHSTMKYNEAESQVPRERRSWDTDSIFFSSFFRVVTKNLTV